jgi:hypothetical protein
MKSDGRIERFEDLVQSSIESAVLAVARIQTPGRSFIKS